MSALPIVVAKALLLHTLLLSMHTATIVALAIAIPATLANTTDTIFLDTLANLTITTTIATTMATATALALASSSSVAASIFEAGTPNTTSSDTWMSVRTVGAIVGVLAIFIVAVVALNCLGYRGLRRFFPGLLRQNAQGVLIAPIGLANIHTGQPGPVPQPAPIAVGTGGAVVAVRFPPAPPSPVKLSPR